MAGVAGIPDYVWDSAATLHVEVLYGWQFERDDDFNGAPVEAAQYPGIHDESLQSAEEEQALCG